MTIQTYQAWAKKNDAQCRRFVGWDRGRRLFRVTNRTSILIGHGFKLISGGMMNDCTVLTETRGQPNTPRAAVEKFIEDEDYSEVVYFPHPTIATGILVWAKR